jgi:serine/threonine protein kinase/Tfp pilus assembly protein PilF
MAPENTLETVRAAVARNYDVEREVGQGGMARVYLARDRKHDRNVAIKVLEPDIAITLATERFLREIKICARLTHPHILPLLDSGHAGKQAFYVMPFVDGESMRDRLERSGRFPVDEAVSLAREVADALDYAHVAGVIHRDIKPENVLILGNHAVVLDFGVGRALSAAKETTKGYNDNITMVGTVVGTPAYMSPEQATGDPSADGRSDQYSLAVMLYELITGYQPFKGPTAQAVMAKRFTETPRRLDEVRAETPAHVADAVAKALAREPQDRFKSCGEFGRALATPGVAVPSASKQLAQLPSVAVLPFANVGGDPDNQFLSDGITDEVIAALTRLRTLRVAARTSSYAVAKEGGDIASAGARLKVESVLEGSIQRAGNRVRIKARLVNVADGFQRWAEQFDETLEDVFEIQDRISQAISTALESTILGVALPAARSQSTNAATYELYLRGQFHSNKRTVPDLERAVALFTAAIDADGEYAPAYAGLAEAYALLGVYGARAPLEVMPLARGMAAKALARDPSLAEPHATLASIAAVHDHNWEESERAFARALTLSPTYVTGRMWRGMILGGALGRFESAVDDLTRARALDPLSLVARMSEGIVLTFSGAYDKAIASLKELISIEPNFPMAYYFMSAAQSAAGQHAEAKANAQRAISLTGGTTEMRARLARAHAALGENAEADAIVAELESERKAGYIPATQIAQVHIARGRLDEALTWLQTALQEHDAELLYLAERQAYDPLRALPAFKAILQQLNLPTTGPKRLRAL